MVDMLTDMLVLFETDGMLASSVEVDVTTVDDQWRAVAKVRGEPYDGDRHHRPEDTSLLGRCALIPYIWTPR